MSDEFIDDPVFGRLLWDDKYTLFCDFDYAPETRVQVTFSADFEEQDADEVVATARKALARLRKNERTIRAQTAEALLALPEAVEAKLSVLDLANRLLIKALEFDEDGHLTVVWECGALFGGRRAYTFVRPSGKFDQAGVANEED
jgi:hypothetical protein